MCVDIVLLWMPSMMMVKKGMDNNGIFERGEEGGGSGDLKRGTLLFKILLVWFLTQIFMRIV